MFSQPENTRDPGTHEGQLLCVFICLFVCLFVIDAVVWLFGWLVVWLVGCSFVSEFLHFFCENFKIQYCTNISRFHHDQYLYIRAMYRSC